MKNYVVMTALAMLIAAPAHAQTVNDTNIKKTMTAVEKAALEQGFIPNTAGQPAPAYSGAAPAPGEIENSSVLMNMAPEAPVAADPAPAAAAQPTATRPALVTADGLPYGLVMNGPGTEAYKKKHRKKKKKKAAVEQAAPAPVAEEKPAPAPTPVVEPVVEQPPVMPDVNAVPPQQMEAPVPSPEPAPAPEPAPSPEPAPAPPTDLPVPDMGLPEPAPAPAPAPNEDPLGLNKPAAPPDPFAAPAP